MAKKEGKNSLKEITSQGEGIIRLTEEAPPAKIGKEGEIRSFRIPRKKGGGETVGWDGNTSGLTTIHSSAGTQKKEGNLPAAQLQKRERGGRV